MMYNSRICIVAILAITFHTCNCKPQNTDVEKRFLFNHHHNCQTLPTTHHGKFTCAGTTHKDGQQCPLTCNTGYRITGSLHTAECDNGDWKIHSSCVAILCAPPTAVLHGFFDCKGGTLYPYGAKCTLTCTAGYAPSNSHTTISCGISSTWSTTPSCVEIRCPAPSVVIHGTYHCPHGPYKLGASCTLKCSTGYKPKGSAAISCTSQSTWSSASCVEIKCPAPPHVTHGAYKCDKTTNTLHTGCLLQCRIGYRPSASSRISCQSTGQWSTPTTCEEIKCPAPPHVTHGAYKCDKTTNTLHTGCLLQCHIGYRPSASSRISCQSTGQWSTPTTCEEIKCPDPPKVTSGQYSCDHRTHRLNDVCHLSCVSGYKPSSTSSVIRCLSSATWSSPSACTEIQCPSPPPVGHGSYQCSHTKYKVSTVCHLHCSTGYKPSSGTHSDISCVSSGKWSTPSTCKEIRCPPPPKLPTGEYRCSRSAHVTYYQLDAQCSLHCPHGYRSSSAVTDITCLASDTWSTTATCIQITCPAPPAVSYGIYRCPLTVPRKMNDVCHLQCSAGYKAASSSSSITCLSSGHWSTSTSCVEIKCPAPPKLSNGVYRCDNTTHKLGEVCQLHCNPGYRPNRASSDISCLQNDQWSAAASCQEIQCPPSPSVANGVYICGHVPSKLNDVCHIRCNTGFKPSSDSPDIHCQATDTWSLPASCKEIKCPDPPAVTNGEYQCSVNRRHLNDVCPLRYRCNTGYKKSSNTSDIKCLATDTWSTVASCICRTNSPAIEKTALTLFIIVKCSEIICPDPPKVSNGVYHCAKTTHKLHDTCHLQCSTGYKPSVSSDIKCLSTDEWSRAGSCMEIKCPTPAVVAHGVYNCDHATSKLNDVCHLQCNTGYKPSSSASDIKCLSTESWSLLKSCIEIKCPSPPKIANGLYQCDHKSTHKFNDTCHLQCSQGYKPSTSPPDIHCLMNDTWSTPSSCKEIHCPVPPTVTNGEYNCTGTPPYKLNDKCQLQCNHGYKSSPVTSDIQCLSREIWSRKGSCVEIHCPVPPVITNGKYSCNNSTPHKLDAQCHIQCHHGYTPTSSSDIRCLSSETWSAPASCHEIQCPAPPIVESGVYHCDNSTVHKLDAVCHLQCNHGYKPDSNHTDLHCLSTNSWSAPASCIENECPAPPAIENGLYHCPPSNTYKANDACFLQCYYGYEVSSNPSQIICQPTGEWSDLVTCKEILCPTPPNVTNGLYKCSNDSIHKLNDECHLNCDYGYKPSSSSPDIRCQLTDTWSAPSMCIERMCDTPPEVANGSYNCSSTTYTTSTSCQIQCDEGYVVGPGLSSIYCQVDETWTISPSCIKL